MTNAGITRKYWRSHEAGNIPAIDIAPIDRILTSLPLDASILDVGCGDGALSEAMISPGRRVHGIDLSDAAITQNRATTNGAHYSNQDITGATAIIGGTIDLFTFRFTLTNIERPAWQNVTQEVGRLAAKASQIWLAEPVVSESYRQRYQITEPITGDPTSVIAFKDNRLASKLATTAALREALDAGEPARICHHFTPLELRSLFPNFWLSESTVAQVTSPSGYPIDTAVMRFEQF